MPHATASRLSGALSAALLVLGATAVTVVAVPVPAAAQATGSGCLTVHAGPQAPAAGASYFQLRVAPGQTVTQLLVLANPQGYQCRVELDASYGKTAINSGDTYPLVEHGCWRTSCWLSGLPATVTLPARSRVDVPFRVTVPAHAGPGEYLAGILARPGGSPRSPPRPLGSTVGAVVKTSVGIGVAVVVPGPLRPRLSIPSVTLGTSGGVPVLSVVERDNGNTWEHPVGGATIVSGPGRPLRLGLSSSTVLPGDSATLTLGVAGAPRGAHPTRVVLWYADRTKQAVWHGVIDYPITKVASSSPSGSEVVVTAVKTPWWAFTVAIVLGGLVVMAGLAMLIFLLGRRRRRREDDRNRPGRHRLDGPAPPPEGPVVPDRARAGAATASPGPDGHPEEGR